MTCSGAHARSGKLALVVISAKKTPDRSQRTSPVSSRFWPNGRGPRWHPRRTIPTNSTPPKTGRRAMTAEAIAKALDGRKTGGSWTARCPAHDDRTPSLSIRESDGDKVLVHCHAGCDQRDVIAALKEQGLWADHGLRSLSQPARHIPVKREQ